MPSHILDPLLDAPEERPAIICGFEEITFGALRERVARASAALRSHGLERGDVVACWHPRPQDSPEATIATIVALLACWHSELVAAPLGTRLPEAAARDRATQLEAAFLNPIELTEAPAAEYRPAPWSLEAPSTIIYTSGSTGEPRAALLSLGNHVWSARGWQERLGLTGGARWLLTLPLSHVSGIAVVVRCLLAHATVVVPTRDESPEDILLDGRVSHASIVDVQLRRLLESGGPPPPEIEMLLLGGGPAARGLVAESVEAGWPVIPSYGMTEAASTITAVPAGAPAKSLATAGSVLPHRKVRIDDEGEVLIGGRVRFQGYLGEGGSLDVPFDEEGFFATGDMGEWVEADGQRMLRIVGRKDNRFTSGGEIVAPEQIELALQSIAGVRRGVVVPVPDELFGERPVAVVDSSPIRPEELRARLAELLPSYLIPDRFLPWPDQSGEAALSKISRSFFREYVASVIERDG